MAEYILRITRGLKPIRPHENPITSHQNFPTEIKSVLPKNEVNHFRSDPDIPTI